MDNSLTALVFVSVLNGLSVSTYWHGRHYYSLQVLPSRGLGDESGNIVIFERLALIPAGYIGGIIIDELGLLSIVGLVVIIFLISVIPLFNIKEERDKNININFMKVFKKLPKKAISFFIFDNFRVLYNIFFVMYLYLYVKSNFSYVGLFGMVVGLASMVFVYFFCRKMDRDRKDYLIVSASLLGIIWFAKANVVGATMMLFLGVLEGFACRMYETATVRDLYALGKQYDSSSYIFVYETLNHITRIGIVLLAFLLGDLKAIIYICIIGTIIGGIIGFDDGKAEY
jgi:hypothetical protein